jgi:riboflavin synthase
MFTGLIETIGVIKSARTLSEGKSYAITARFEGENLRVGESIAVDGICLTVESYTDNGFSCTASAETQRRGTLEAKKVGEKVHLERALRLGDRLGGHLVQGHVDGIGIVRQLIPRGVGVDLVIEIPENLQAYVVEKGSLAVQGVSLTVAKMETGLATIAVIPETLRRTYLAKLRVGSHVNLEVDVLAKYVESLLSRNTGIDAEKLRNWGFD